MRTRAGLLEVGLLLAMVVVAMSLVMVPLLGQGGVGLDGSVIKSLGEPLSVQAELVDPVVEGLAAGTYGAGEAVELSGPTTTTASVSVPDLQQRVGLVGGPVVLGLSALTVLLLLLQIVRTLRRGDPFVHANARRLRRVAAVVAIGGMASELLRGFGTVGVLQASAVSERVVPAAELSFIPLVAALVIGLLAEVFAIGAGLRDDVEGLV